jgi:ATP-dependent DNA helicase RecQ
LIKYLLRSYHGILDNIVSISEKQIAKLTNLSIELVHQQLLQLKAFHIIVYHPQKETPQIFFLQSRAPAEHLVFNQEDYLNRKKEYELRVQAMLSYVRLQKGCRSQSIGKYFGDAEMKSCGLCDNCLQQKNTALTEQEFKTIEQEIFSYLNTGNSEIKDLLFQLKTRKKDKVWKVINYLQSERKIVVTEAGAIQKA